MPNSPEYNKQYRILNRNKIIATEMRYKLSLKGKYKKVKDKARERKLTMDITLAQYEEIIRDRKCFYSGTKLDDQGGNLDRIDNSKPYTIDNVVPCCKNCNFIKGNRLTHEETIEVIKLLKKLRNKENLWE